MAKLVTLALTLRHPSLEVAHKSDGNADKAGKRLKSKKERATNNLACPCEA